MPDIILEITVPEAWQQKTLNAFNTITNAHLTIEASGHAPEPEDEFNGRWDFRIEPKGSSETAVEFGQRVLRELGKAVINMVDRAEDEQRYRDEVSAVTPPASDVPEDVLT